PLDHRGSKGLAGANSVEDLILEVGARLDGRESAHERERLPQLFHGGGATAAPQEVRLQGALLFLIQLVLQEGRVERFRGPAVHTSSSRFRWGLSRSLSISRARLIRERTVPPGIRRISPTSS